MERSILEEVGLTKGEAEVYLILLKTGEATASIIAKNTKIARPNVYDYINKLKEKGFVSFVNKNHKNYYVPASPKKLLDFLDQKRQAIEFNMPDLLQLYKPKKEAAQIEVYEGSEGFTTLINDILNVKNDFVGWGASDRLREFVPEHIVKRYLKMREKYNIKGKMLYTKPQSLLRSPLSIFKSIPQEFSSPSTTIIYGDRVAICIYSNIPITIIIKNKEVADTYRNHFKLLWNTVSKKNKS
jgi:sugar-specific transcriptional regulator TrmB